jgi:hypothetical protein
LKGEVLLQFFKKQLNLPSVAISLSDDGGIEFKVIANELVGPLPCSLAHQAKVPKPTE